MKTMMPLGGLLLILVGCVTSEQKVAPRVAPVLTVAEHRTAFLRIGGTITNWNDEEIWVAPGVQFRPRTPPIPKSLRSIKTSMAANSFEASVAAGINSSPHIDALTAPVSPTFPSLAMPHIPAIVHARQTIDGLDAGEWQHDPAVYSPNVVVDPGTNGAPSLFLHWSIPQ